MNISLLSILTTALEGRCYSLSLHVRKLRLPCSWSHTAAKRPNCHLTTALSDAETQVVATTLYWEVPTAPGNDHSEFTWPQPTPLGPHMAPSWPQRSALVGLGPKSHHPQQGSWRQLAQSGNKGSFFSPFFRNLDSMPQKQPLRLAATMATGCWSLSNYVSPELQCLRVHFLSSSPAC